MKILLVNIHGYLSYGTESYFLNLAKLLKKQGHEVIIFSSKDKRNIDNTYADYFVDNLDFNNFHKTKSLKKILSTQRAIYSFSARRRIEKLIAITRPDIAHIHNIKYIISPSILDSLKKFCIPIVQTLHDYHLVCPNYRLYQDGRLCEACGNKRFYLAILKKCIRNSIAFSILGCLEHYFNKFRGIFKQVDAFIAPSNFMRQKILDCGFAPEKVLHIPHFIFIDDYQADEEFEDYIIYSGRLAKEKGLLTLIKAVSVLPAVKLLILGDGEYRQELEQLVVKERLKNVEFKGYLGQKDLKTVIQKARFTVVPSEWPEIFGLVVLESFALGKPVIGAKIGSLPELIDDGVDGLLFKPQDTDDLAIKIEYLFNNKNKILKMGQAARNKILKNYNSQIHYEKIFQVYQKLIGQLQRDSHAKEN